MDSVVFTYSDVGLRTKMKYPLGPGAGSEEVTNEYNLANKRLWKKISPQGTITYSYDDAGKLTSLSSSHRTTVTTTVTNNYDALNRLVSVSEDPDGDPKTTVYRYEYERGR